MLDGIPLIVENEGQVLTLSLNNADKKTIEIFEMNKVERGKNIMHIIVRTTKIGDAFSNLSTTNPLFSRPRKTRQPVAISQKRGGIKK